jgi:hypothetical protein
VGDKVDQVERAFEKDVAGVETIDIFCTDY